MNLSHWIRMLKEIKLLALPLLHNVMFKQIINVQRPVMGAVKNRLRQREARAESDTPASRYLDLFCFILEKDSKSNLGLLSILFVCLFVL